ncbi:NusA-like transcription termination signal-binding factor [Candidatus Woesearchaeota archaeon]|nr:NusA-like transcription termination signal-binding factor [Candidatus Woesearchaeota archaeon]
MVVKKYDIDLINYMNIFKKVTKINPKDCFKLDEVIIFVTEPGKAGLAIGKGGKNIQQLKNNLKKEFKILEGAETPEKLAKNFVYPAKPISISVEDGILKIQFSKGRERRMLLTDKHKRLNQLKAVIKRYHPEIEDVVIPQS